MKKGLVLMLVGLLVLGMVGSVMAADEVNIRLLKPGNKDAYQWEVDLASEYMAEHPNVDIEVIGVGWGDAYSKIMTMVVAGNTPDIMYVGTRWIPALVQMKAIDSLDSYITDEKKSLYFNPLIRGTHYNDKLYALPRAFSTKALIYRTDLIPEPPNTWDEIIQIAKKVQSENDGIYGLGIAGAKHVSTTTQFFNYVYQNGGDIFDEDGNILLNSPQTVKALEFYVDLYREHNIVPNPVEYNREELPNLFKVGKIAMFVCGPWAKPMIGEGPGNDKVPYASAPLPKGRYDATTLVSDSLVMSSTSKNKEAVWDYLNWATSLKNQKRYDLNHGLVPAMNDELEDPAFTNNDFFNTYINMISYGQPQPLPLAWEPFQEIITTAIQKSLLGEMEPTDALNEAVQQIKEQNLTPVR